MRKIVIALAATVALLASPALQARDKFSPEQRLEKMLEGREAGKPVSCISTWSSHSLQILDKTALVYDTGNVIYVNRPANADMLDDDDILVIKMTGSQLCRLDSVSLHDRGGGFYRGFVNLNDFVPYRRIAKAN